MMPPRSRKPDLSDDLLDRIEVRQEQRLLERLLPDEAAGVDVDGDERLRLVDDDIAARREPNPRSERLLDLGGDAVLLEERLGSAPQSHARSEAGMSSRTSSSVRWNSFSLSTRIDATSSESRSRSSRCSRAGSR